MLMSRIESTSCALAQQSRIRFIVLEQVGHSPPLVVTPFSTRYSPVTTDARAGVQIAVGV